MWTRNLHKLFQNEFVKPYDGSGDTRPYGSLGIKNYRGEIAFESSHSNNHVTMVDGVPTCVNGVPVKTISGSYINSTTGLQDLDIAPLFSCVLAPYFSGDPQYMTSPGYSGLRIMFGSDGTPVSYEDELLGHVETDIQIIKVGTTITANGAIIVHSNSWSGYRGACDYYPPSSGLTWKDKVSGSIIVWVKNSTTAPITLREMGITQKTGAWGDYYHVLIGRFLVPVITIQPDEIAEVSFTVC